MDGSQRIAEERHRQVALFYSASHDDEHDNSELLAAAECYLKAAGYTATVKRSEAGVRRIYERRGEDPEADEDFRRMIENPARHAFGWDKAPKDWPWEIESWQPSADPIRNLEKAGALIAAEIDRLLRVQPT